MDVIIIGAGAAGLMAAIEAGKKNNKVTVLELKNEAGRKILATGNGRCNLTNRNIESSCYFGDDKSFIEKVIQKIDYEYIKKYFEDMGLLFCNIGDYVYPYSKQSSSVTNVLLRECKKHNINFVFNCNVKNIEKKYDNFTINAIITEGKNTYKKEFFADKVIVTAGGKASPKFGSDGSGYYLLKKLGHRVNDVVPALVPMICDDGNNGHTLKKLHGVRAEASIIAYYSENNEKKNIATERGEIQLTDYGISGIVTFQLSGRINHCLAKNKKVYVEIDFMPDYSKEELKKYLACAVEKNIDYFGKVREAYLSVLNGMLNDKLAEVIIERVWTTGKDKETGSGEILIKQIVELTKGFKFKVTASRGFEFAQVSSGGVTLKEVNENMGSKLVDGVYIAGEVLDVDGMCGGYNLHFAFASGIIAGNLK